MSIPRIIEAMDHIDDDLISGAADFKRNVNRTVWVRWAAVAACLCLAAAGLFIRHQIASSKSASTDPVSSESGVTIPERKFTLSADSNAESDMIAFFIYQGHVYVFYEWSDNTEIAGEYLGTATGLINEWTPKDGYVEFAGSIKGDFYSVKGYDPSFMLCLKETDGALSTYICDNGITLTYGSELYEDRLHLTGNYNAVQYETRESWYYSKNKLYQLDESSGVISSFIDQLDKAAFMSWQDVPAREGKTIITIYDTEIYHLYFRMKDGMTIHLRLYENGYVRFQGLLDVCVQVPKDCFNALTGMLQENIGS